jgi:hypothetical protein
VPASIRSSPALAQRQGREPHAQDVLVLGSQPLLQRDGGLGFEFRERRRATRGRADRRDEVALVPARVDEPVGPGQHGGGDRAGVVAVRVEHDVGRRDVALDQPGQLDAVGAARGVLDDHDVRRGGVQHVADLVDVTRGTGHDLDVSRLREQRPDARSHRGLTVDHCYANHATKFTGRLCEEPKRALRVSSDLVCPWLRSIRAKRQRQH